MAEFANTVCITLDTTVVLPGSQNPPHVMSEHANVHEHPQIVNYQHSEEVRLKMEDEDKRELLSSVNENLKECEALTALLKKAISECVIELYSIAEDIDKFHKRATITNVVGSTFGIAGGILSIIGLALIPVTLGVSLILSGVGIGVATAGGVTGASASIADTVNMKKKCKEASKKGEEINDKITKLQEHTEKMIETIKALQTKRSGQEAVNAARIGARGVFVGVEISRLVQLGRIAAQGAEIAAQAARAIRAVSGVFTALFVIIDVAFIIKSGKELHEGAKTNQAQQIREQADSLLEIRAALTENMKSMRAEVNKNFSAK
ncbi:apolipoprotein L3-like [Hyperolius riggenbachi]|uniref:apolipoprotein L3-like n=1 Tax=Hyperolius riggenbachi TaxID=752182 RepID=UPI0035A388D1